MRSFVFFITSLFLISLGVLSVIIFNSNPFASGTQTIFGAILFVFLTLQSAISLLSVIYTRYIAKGEINFVATLRRSTIISALISGLVALKVLSVLSVISGLSYFLALLLIEVFFTLRKKEKYR